MRRQIIDEFSHLAGQLSRQRLYQLRMRQNGLCIICGDEADGQYCAKHKAARNKRDRDRYSRNKLTKC